MEEDVLKKPEVDTGYGHDDEGDDELYVIFYKLLDWSQYKPVLTEFY